MATDEREYARLVALGQLGAIKGALADCRDLLAAIDDLRAEQLNAAVSAVWRIHMSLSEEAANVKELQPWTS